ncbi:hypothetical protein B484DRAFT_428568 [Ochromonadaceae sp. CCMP2298]|nr:hypothetical protein B484DRAFT_428568 [Ochromonadaceae sp. CCMP2298]
MKFLSSVRRGRKKSDASQGGNSQASAEESQSGTQGSHTGKSKRRPSLFAFSPRLRTDSAAEAGTGVGAPSRDLPPCIALRLRVRGVSRYRVCSADPQGEYAADNWVLMVGEFQQDFFLPAAMLGPKSGRDGVGEGAGEGCPVRFEVICSSEFNEPIPNFLPRVQVSLRAYGSVSITGVFRSVECADLRVVTKGSVFKVQFSAPLERGYYSVHVVEGSTSAVLVLPLLSELFRVCGADDQASLQTSRVLLGCYRSFPCPLPDLPVASSSGIEAIAVMNVGANVGRAVYIREEYGAALGSHVYDSSVVLMRYLQVNWRPHSTGPRAVLDLGAGCGVLGLWLAQYTHYLDCLEQGEQGQHAGQQGHLEAGCAQNTDSVNRQRGPDESAGPRVFLTDKASQLDLMRHNAAVNGYGVEIVAGAGAGGGDGAGEEDGDGGRDGAVVAMCVGCGGCVECADRVQCVECDWAAPLQVQSLRSLTRGRLGLVLAADVFYDPGVAALLLELLRTLAPDTVDTDTADRAGPTILVAQKLRGVAAHTEGQTEEAKVQLADAELLCGFRSVTLLHREANVCIWALQL